MYSSCSFAFSLMMSVRNLSLLGTDWVGAKLIDDLHWSFESVVWASAIVAALAVPIALLLPSGLVGHKDAETLTVEGSLPTQLPITEPVL